MSRDTPRLSPTRVGVYSDDPVSSPEQDLFSRSAYADRIAEVARQCTKQVDSAVIALIGPNGSGKTSMLNFVRQRLNETQSFNVVTFNPWIAGDLASLARDFFNTLRSAMPGAGGWRMRRRLVRYAKKTAPILGTVSVAGMRVNTAEIVEQFGGDSPLAHLRDKLMAELRRLDVPILITIDDIDRLQADELILIAKLMRLVGRLPNVYYLVCFDEKNIVSVVSGVLPGDNTEQRARVYLERTVQIKFEMPPLDPLSAYRLFSHVLEATLARHTITMDNPARDRLLFVYRELLARGLQTPPQIRRFCAHLEPHLVYVGSDLDIVDYVAISYLRFAHPHLADTLKQCESQLVSSGTCGQAQAINWPEQLAQAGVSTDDLSSVGSLLSFLFPAMEPEALPGGPHTPSLSVPENGVSSPSHFRRYFNPGTMFDSVDDETINEGLREVLDDKPGYAWSMLAFYDVEQTVAKLREHAPSDAHSAPKLLRALIRLAQYTPSRGEDIATRMPTLHSWMVELADTVEANEASQIVR